VQTELLEKNPSANLRIYAVWYNMIGSDSRRRWPEDLLTDPRAIHFWDEKKLLGRFYTSHLGLERADEVLWDAYILYGPQASWEKAPPAIVSWGNTIVRTRDQLRREVLPLLEEKTSGRGAVWTDWQSAAKADSRPN
jgi:hypothetical protein